jgi:MFS family permease
LKLIALGHRDFRLLQAARFLLIVGIEMINVAVGWRVYELTHRPLDLGYVGLAQFLPLVAFWPVAGHTADRFDRRKIFLVCQAAILIAVAALGAVTLLHVDRLGRVYAFLVTFGAARAFMGPAGQSLGPSLVPPAILPNAIAWSSAAWQMAAVVGPMIGGLLYVARGVHAVYCGVLLATLAAMALTSRMRADSEVRAARGASLAALLGGVTYVLKTRIIFASIALDLFAVLFGGAVALFPALVRDHLEAGPWALGIVRSAPSVGALITAGWLAASPLARRTGAKMLTAVLVFGLCTIVLAISKNLLLSALALAVAGAADMVSVVVRTTLIQIATPAEMRGRVTAVNFVFTGASNELGEFESGLTAQWLGVVRATVLGGVATCLLVGLWVAAFPSLRRLDRLEDARSTG